VVSIPRAKAYIFEWGMIKREVSESIPTGITAPTVTTTLTSESVDVEVIVSVAS